MSSIKNLSEFFKEIIRISKKYKKKDNELFFRGESEDHKTTKCKPGIFRKSSLIENEHNMFRDFITLNPDEFYNDKLTIDKLTRMQHYQLPTRLLDISSNALPTLYFACENESEKKDAIVYLIFIIKEKIKYYDSDTVSVIANLAKREQFTFNINTNTNVNIKKFNNNQNIKYLLHNIKDEKPYFKDEIESSHLNSIVCVKPLQNNKRIIRQQGSFLLFGNDSKNKTKSLILEKTEGIKVERIVIDKKSKVSILKELEMTGINKATIYPEMPKVAEYLTKKYSDI